MAGTRYEYYIVDDDANLAVMDVFWRGMQFTPATAHIITSVKIKALRVGTPGTMTISIRATSGGLPTGVDLCSGTYDADTLTTDAGGEWIEVTFGVGTSLATSTMYAIVVRAPSGTNPTPRVDWRQDSTVGYANNTGLSSGDSGSSWATYAGDLMFEDWGYTALHPSDAQTRVTSLIHRYDRGTYTLEINLGEVIADFGLPEWESKPKTAIPKEEEPFPEGGTEEIETPTVPKTIPTRKEFWSVYPGVPYPYD